MRYLVLCLLVGCKFQPGSTVPPPLTECSAGNHAWGNYHLQHHAMNPVLVNRSGYEPDIESWNELEGNPIRLRSSGSGFEIIVEEGGDKDSGWLGLASVTTDGRGHIFRGVVTMNRTLLSKYGPNVAAHVLSQEIGHIFGLDHQRGADDSSMDDCQGRGAGWLHCLSTEAGMTPNKHDGDQLAAKYAHVTGDPLPKGCFSAETEVILHEFRAEDGGHAHH